MATGRRCAWDRRKKAHDGDRGTVRRDSERFPRRFARSVALLTVATTNLVSDEVGNQPLLNIRVHGADGCQALGLRGISRSQSRPARSQRPSTGTAHRGARSSD